MAPLVTRVLGVVRRPAARRLGDCLVCRGPVAEDERPLRLRGGVLVHRRCATYRMRRRAGHGG